MSVSIKVENLSKAYQIGQIGTGTVSRDLERWWITKVMGKEDPFLKIGQTNDRTVKGESDIVWSLKDINFEFQHGEAVGIIGKNGAGKSTLLKVLSRITSPTTGKIKIKGRVASLLEVGTGFHPELTGRENIYLNGSILGMRRKEITRKLDEIIDFSGVERYIDTPVKRYSSGMYVRLAFAVAAHLETEIMIVDEVLAVGDAEFQKKCLGKMKDVSSEEGRTVLFVSHNMLAVEGLCRKVVYLDKGEVKKIAAPKEAISQYLEGRTLQTRLNFDDIEDAIGDDTIKVKSIKASPSNISVEDEIGLEFEFWNLTDEENLIVSFDLHNSHDLTVFSTGSPISVKPNSIGKSRCIIPPSLLNDGVYNIYIFFFTQDMRPLFRRKDIYSFTVEDVKREFAYYGKINGVVRPKLKWEVTT